MITNPMLPHPGKLVEVRDLATEIKLFRVELQNDCQDAFQTFLPGQFAFVSAFGAGEAPFGIANAAGRSLLVDFAIAQVGSVTTSLHELDVGDWVGVRGPLGNSFPMDKFKGRDLIVIGGGIGGAPLRPVIQHVLDHRSDYGRLTILWAARQPSLLIFTDEYNEWRAAPDTTLHLTVDKPEDSWKHEVGLITQLLEKVRPDTENAVAVTCGPPVMIQNITRMLTSMGIPDTDSYVTLEARMHCGLGKCGRCNLGEKLICKDGPVFNMAEIANLLEKY